MKIIAIAGGSGSGKSTVSNALLANNPGRIDILHFDDYQRLDTEANLPLNNGRINWDHPDIINWSALIADLQSLKAGQTVKVNTKSERLNPTYHQSHQRLSHRIKPQSIIIAEGYLALYNPEVNLLYDLKIFLELDEATRNQRRNKPADDVTKDDYSHTVLNPMHHKYVEPSKQNADVVIDVSKLAAAQVTDRIQELLAQLI